MTQQPALERGQVWGTTNERRAVYRVTSEQVDFINADGELVGCSWTAWRDWQQRHDARVQTAEDVDGR